ncbi:hypothetical protein OJ998_10530 [Solirubrobacter taibaiensis]|nr:hypothetical protein [Solirubrobacter taibaiensis]
MSSPDPSGPLSGEDLLAAVTDAIVALHLRDRFVEAVERLSGRKVVAFISNHHVGPDLAVELFWLDGVR